MDLESARALKTDLLERFAAPHPERVLAARAFALPAMPLETVQPVRESLAVGLLPHQGAYRLAVRVQRPELMYGTALAEITSAAGPEPDIRYIGQVKPLVLNLLARTRPLVPGLSIGHHAVTAGTLGGFVNSAAGKLAILSNNHVLAASNSGRAGDPVLQPGVYDGGREDRDIVARLAEVIPLSSDAPNLIDCALAELDDPGEAEVNGLAGWEAPTGVGEATDGEAVRKVGRTTQATSGRVLLTEVDNVVIHYSGLGNIQFNGQIEIEGRADGPFAAPGDSGAVVVSVLSKRAVGLVCGGSEVVNGVDPPLTYANDLTQVLSALSAEFVA